MHLPTTVHKNNLERFIADQVKNKRSYFAKQIKVGVCADSEPVAVPSLWTLIVNVHTAMDPLFKCLTAEKIHSDTRISRGTKIRISYLRFMINMHRITLPHKPKGKAISFWDDIDEDLKSLRHKSKAHGIAYSQLIFDRDQQLWDGHKTVINVPEADQQPPSEEAVIAKINSLTTRAAPQVELQAPELEN
jgi:hypothetical protein